MNTARLLGRTTAGVGVPEEISVANGLSLSALTLGIGASLNVNSAAAGSGFLQVGTGAGVAASPQNYVRIYGGANADLAPVLSLFRTGNTEGGLVVVGSKIKLFHSNGLANLTDTTLSAAVGITIDTAGQLAVPATTVSTSTTTGAAVISGGLGVVGSINAGNTITQFVANNQLAASPVLTKHESLIWNGTNSVLKINNPVTYNYRTGPITGTLKLTCPTPISALNNSMLTIRIKGYDYTSNGCYELLLGGYHYATSPSWLQTSATLIGEAPFTSVRFSSDGTNLCILLGDTSTVWQHPIIEVEEITVGYSGVVVGWTTGWTLGIITDETGYVLKAQPTLRKVIHAGNLGSTGLPIGGTTGSFSGIVSITNATASTTTATGALQVSGGIGAVGQVNADSFIPWGTASGAGSISRSASAGLKIQGITGSTYDFAVLNPANSLYVMGVPTGTDNLKIVSTTAASSISTGALTVAGGLGVAGNIYGGGLASFTGTVYSPTFNLSKTVNPAISMLEGGFQRTLVWLSSGDFYISSFDSAGTLIDDAFKITNTTGGLITSRRPVNILSSTASTSSITGALIVTGGVGVGGAVNVAGNVSFAAGQKVDRVASAISYSILTTDYYVVYTGTGGHSFTLPTAAGAGAGAVFIIKHNGSGVLTITRAGTDTIDGSVSITPAIKQSVMLISDGATNFEIN
jgi:hypothetical protein